MPTGRSTLVHAHCTAAIIRINQEFDVSYRFNGLSFCFDSFYGRMPAFRR